MAASSHSLCVSQRVREAIHHPATAVTPHNDDLLVPDPTAAVARHFSQSPPAGAHQSRPVYPLPKMASLLSPSNDVGEEARRGGRARKRVGQRNGMRQDRWWKRRHVIRIELSSDEDERAVQPTAAGPRSVRVREVSSETKQKCLTLSASVHPLSSLLLFLSAAANPSCHWADGGANPGQTRLLTQQSMRRTSLLSILMLLQRKLASHSAAAIRRQHDNTGAFKSCPPRFKVQHPLFYHFVSSPAS